MLERHVRLGRGDDRALEGQEDFAAGGDGEAAGVPKPGFTAFLRTGAPAFRLRPGE